MNSLGNLIRIPSLFRAYSLLEAAPRLIHSRHLLFKDVTTINGGDNGNDDNMDTLVPHTTQTTGLQDSKKNQPPSSIDKFQIYKTVPPDIHELFLKKNERLRYRKLNEMFKKEMNQVILKETLPSNGQDGSKMTRVALKRNAIYDAKLDNIVKNLLSETRSVITKMTRQTSQHRISKSFDSKNRTMLAGKETTACDIKPGTNSRSSDGNSSSHSGGIPPLPPPPPPPPPTSSDVIVSPYVDDKGNIDYTRAVIKSTGSDTAAADILKRLIQDPVKPLPIFEIPDTQQQTETVLLRGDGTQETIGDGTSSSTFTRDESTFEPTKLSSENKSKSADSKVQESTFEPTKPSSEKKSKSADSKVQESTCEPKKLSSENKSKSADSKVPSTMKVGSRLATSKNEKPELYKDFFSDCMSKVPGKKSSDLEKKSGTDGSHMRKDTCRDKGRSSKSPKLSSSRKPDDGCKYPMKVQMEAKDSKQAKTKSPETLITTMPVLTKQQCQYRQNNASTSTSKSRQQKHLGEKSKVNDSKYKDNTKKESDKPHNEPDGKCG